ncbi:glycoside hydrolase family 76 protein [Dyadobacter psychrotolerans]|uniref:Glycoside hydrolase n=1 Tax=Dyadobacter psychrotolerans TaxID=2541721 RepID=A0A4R5DWY4_9BACT|nr:glycoside hydrolase family 76 protein [Dyadobacter psychrotolerans]TDE18407.1 glycoside hydrolase [Dyadobacter psychrotolerans]
MMIKTALLFSIIILSNFRLSAQSPDYRGRIVVINQNINKIFYKPETGLYIETNGKNDKPHSYLWPLCALMQAANETEQLEPKKEYLKPVLAAIQQYHNNEPPAPGYQAYVTKEGKDSRFYDDNQWVAIAALDAYNRTGKKTYLTLAEEIYRFMMTGFDEKSGGGLYWKEDEKNTKNTCSNGPGILVALQLYKITKKKEYLTVATQLYDWTNKHLRAPNGIYWDAIKIPDMKIDSAKYTYNTGTMLQSNVLFYQIMKEKKYLDEAIFVADAAEKFFYKNGKLPGNYWFNVVLLRGYEELYKVDKNKERFRFFVSDAERIWSQERDENNLLGRKKEKGLIDQAAIMEMYTRLERLK